MILDEFARLGNLPAISTAFGFSAGFNLQLWPFLQDMPQLQDIYGKRWMSILANCGIVQFFTPVVLKTERSESRSDSRVPLLPPEWMMGFPLRLLARFLERRGWAANPMGGLLAGGSRQGRKARVLVRAAAKRQPGPRFSLAWPLRLGGRRPPLPTE